MDLIILIGIASALLVILLATWLFTRQPKPKETKNESESYWFSAFIAYLLLFTIQTLHGDGTFFSQKNTNTIDVGPSRRINQGDASDSNIPRRAQIARNQRRNAPQASTSHQEESDDSEGESNRPNPFAETKMGTKKRAKLEAKAERQRLREAETVAREVWFDFKLWLLWFKKF